MVRRIVLLIMAGILMSGLTSQAQEVTREQADLVAATYAESLPQTLESGGSGLLSDPSPLAGHAISNVNEIVDQQTGKILAYVYDLDPAGYVVVSSDTDIKPVIAYSTESSFNFLESDDNALLGLLKGDMKLRLDTLALTSLDEKLANQTLWADFESGGLSATLGVEAQTWGPWLTTQWAQSPYYNAECPLDPVSGDRSVTGCVATALAQILKYHGFPQTVRFDYDYVSSTDPDGGGERVIEMSGTIDETFDYSLMSDSLSSNNQQVAALMFAAGVAVEMNYSSLGSGTGLRPVETALLGKFGYQSANLVLASDSTFYDQLSENMINGQPVELAIFKPNYTSGHAIVCDGYRDTGEYHLNYGWGADGNGELYPTGTGGWYFLPNMGSGYTIVYGAVLDILPGSRLGVQFDSYTIDDDNSDASSGNNNEQADAGERIELIISLANPLSTDATGVSATLSTTSSYVTISDNYEVYADIPAYGSAECQYDFDFSVAADLPAMTTATFSLQIEDARGNISTDTFDITLYPVEQALSIAYDASVIDDDTSGGSSGNADGLLNIGERVELGMTLRNTGTLDRPGVSATLSSSDSCVVDISDSYEYFGDIAAGGTAQSEWDYDFDISANCQAGHEVEFQLDIVDGNGATGTDIFKLTVQDAGVSALDVGFASLLIDDDTSGGSYGNSDGFVNAGETVEMVVTLQNFESVAATGVEAVLNTADPYVTITDPIEFYGNISAGGSAACQYDYDFSVSGDCPDDHVVTFTLEISDAYGNTNSDTFEVTVKPSDHPFNVELSAYSLDDDTLGGSFGNGDGIVNIGEVIEMEVTLANLETVAASSVVAVLSTTSPYVTITDSVEDFGDIPAGGAVTCRYDFDFEVSPDCPDGQVVSFTLAVTDGAGKTDTVSLSIAVHALASTFDVSLSSLVIDDDNSGGSSGNGDGTANIGETVELLVTLENSGSEDVAGVVAVLSSSDACVSISDNVEDFGLLTAGGTATCVYDYDFTIASSCPDGHVASFTLDVSDANGNSDSETFDLTFVAADTFNVELADTVIDDDISGGSYGNSDGAVNAGETIEMVVSLLNPEASTAFAVNARLSTSDSYVTLLDDVEDYGDISAGGTASCYYDYDFVVDASCPDGHVIDFVLTVTDSNGRIDSIDLPVTVVGGGSLVTDDAYEENDILTDAAPLSDNGTYASLECLDDDWYEVYAYSGDQLDVSIQFTDAVSDLDLKLVNESGVVVAGSYSITDNESVSYSVGSSGRYYIKVYDYDGNGNSYDLAVGGIGQGAGTSLDVAYVSHLIDDDTSGGSNGDGNGVLNPGEDVEIVVTLRNDGSQTASGVSATIEINDPYVVAITDAYEVFGDIAAGGTASCEFDYDIEVSTDCPDGHVLPVTLYVADANGLSDTVSFEITVSGSGASVTDDSYEENDSIGTAAELSGNGTYGALHCEDDDWYKVYAYAGDQLDVSILFSDAISDLDLKLTNASGVTLVGSYSISDNEAVSYNIATDGYYFIKVYDYGGYGNTYDLVVAGLGQSGGVGSDDSYEENDTRDTAAALSFGNGSYSSLYCGDDDWYVVNATAGDVLQVSIQFSDTTSDLDMTLVNEAGTNVAGSYSVSDNESVSYTVPATGNYFIRVYDYDGNGNAYSLTVAGVS